MPRGSTRPSVIFTAVLDAAARQLHIASSEAAAFRHTGIRGDERAAALASFLRRHLPSNLGVAKGEAIDFLDRRTGQLDILIYDADMAAPISTQSENVLIPAESLLAVIEVKTTLTQNDLNGCYMASRKVRAIRPFKQSFVAAREEGRPAEDGNFRCMYIVFSYETNLSAEDWLNKEFKRLELAATSVKGKLNLIDVVYVLNRGMIRPAKNAGKTNDKDELNMFLEFYLHLVNFLRREMPRRPAMDWQAYSSKTSRGWLPLAAPE
ncbi:hypothetical protein Rfer_1321 [Rhodoferax ferrireducens T118]|uniref:DUF6602 domain-containing protein n=1 Tax=Albidiferax ferrireducens (strain ATCC BAA-621 / DSM 15236 / T118) TaxID=338969 RepID=Q21YU8_ALBFT|nr:DUF6602 domain-containing protein [Rhodoferax ferrireducens]ABD69055.1 hypothetical protein Rfer_1321 [Rhodoferax ferrireducens T118]